MEAKLRLHYSGQDGSRQVTAKVDDAATGKTFVAAQVTKNGDLVNNSFHSWFYGTNYIYYKAPTDVGSQQLTIQLPANTKCTGGSGKDSCLVSFTTAGGFGNCVVVQQKAAANNAAPATAAAAGAAAGAAGAAAAANTNTNGTTAAAHKHHHHKGQQAQAVNNAAFEKEHHQNRDLDARAVVSTYDLLI